MGLDPREGFQCAFLGALFLILAQFDRIERCRESAPVGRRTFRSRGKVARAISVG